MSHIVETAEDPEGAILIFLTGVQEIRQCTDILRTSSIGNSADILPLHANLASDEQRRVFTKTKKRKIVIATNVAEVCHNTFHGFYSNAFTWTTSDIHHYP